MEKQVTQKMKAEITRDMALSIGQVEKTREALPGTVVSHIPGDIPCVHSCS